MEIPFIDIHTHKGEKPGVISIRNIFLKDLDPAFSGFFSAGIHPWHLDNQEVEEKIIFNSFEIAAQVSGMLAIGETGLDKSVNVDMELQKYFFVLQLRLAEKLQKPLIVHCVRAYQEILGLRKESGAKQPWIFHGFSGSPQLALQCINSGCYLSFGALAMKNNQRTINSLKSLGSGNIFLETDSSDFIIEEIYQKAEVILDISEQELKADIYKSFKKVFKYFDK